MKFFQEIGVDLGTTTVLVYIKGKGIVLNEPSVVAVNKLTGEIIEYGEKAKNMIGRTPKNVETVSPLKDGVISDYNITVKMLKHYISKVADKKLLNPNIVICVPSGVTQLERKAVIDATTSSGARKVYIIQEPLAAAIGAKADITKPRGIMVIDVGGGTTDVAVISLGGIVKTKSVKVAGNAFNYAIIKHIKTVYNLAIGEKTAEDIKIKIGSAFKKPNLERLNAKGRNSISGFPGEVNLDSEEIYDVLQEPLKKILEAVKEVLEELPPELSSDIRDEGIYITGGGGLLSGFDRFIADNTKLKVKLADNSETCVAIGTGQALEHIKLLESGNGMISAKKKIIAR